MTKIVGSKTTFAGYITEEITGTKSSEIPTSFQFNPGNAAAPAAQSIGTGSGSEASSTPESPQAASAAPSAVPSATPAAPGEGQPQKRELERTITLGPFQPPISLPEVNKVPILLSSPSVLLTTPFPSEKEGSRYSPSFSFFFYILFSFLFSSRFP